MTVVRTVEYHCDLCGDPENKDAPEPMRGLAPEFIKFRLVPLADATMHLCGQCWRALREVIANEDKKRQDDAG